MNFNTPLMRMIISALGALLFYGVWAFFANWNQDLSSAIRAGCAQGFTSFTSGLVSASMIEGLFKVTTSSKYKLGIVVLIILVSLYHIGGHLLAQTPNLWITVAPALILGNSYNLFYAYLVSKDGLVSTKVIVADYSN